MDIPPGWAFIDGQPVKITSIDRVNISLSDVRPPGMPHLQGARQIANSVPQLQSINSSPMNIVPNLVNAIPTGLVINQRPLPISPSSVIGNPSCMMGMAPPSPLYPQTSLIGPQPLYQTGATVAPSLSADCDMGRPQLRMNTPTPATPFNTLSSMPAESPLRANVPPMHGRLPSYSEAHILQSSTTNTPATSLYTSVAPSTAATWSQFRGQDTEAGKRSPYAVSASGSYAAPVSATSVSVAKPIEPTDSNLGIKTSSSSAPYVPSATLSFTSNTPPSSHTPVSGPTTTYEDDDEEGRSLYAFNISPQHIFRVDSGHEREDVNGSFNLYCRCCYYTS